ncbi:unnamed protein product [Vitrella brassicaformis CCMP3155]|uniref:Uncharacterized protein n=1 Tax=Vitrella brassicaformis (strain CCMP3155) TaxID=1169540 RepID=A0A0G4FFK7_VITBC|nr:unnamed protein product [Vitrella brassicaformis CCMP3155]|eukprot:CEM11984.1 unnamed protein product [Vitrella brassicaformis CCMP3155]
MTRRRVVKGDAGRPSSMSMLTRSQARHAASDPTSFPTTHSTYPHGAPLSRHTLPRRLLVRPCHSCACLRRALPTFPSRTLSSNTDGAGTAGSSRSLSHWYCICMPSLSNLVTLTVCSRLSSFTWRTCTTEYNAGKSEACSSRLNARADTSAI